MNNNFIVFSGRASRYLAEKICDSLGCPLGRMLTQTFADGEFGVCFEETIRGKDASRSPNTSSILCWYGSIGRAADL